MRAVLSPRADLVTQRPDARAILEAAPRWRAARERRAGERQPRAREEHVRVARRVGAVQAARLLVQVQLPELLELEAADAPLQLPL